MVFNTVGVCAGAWLWCLDLSQLSVDIIHNLTRTLKTPAYRCMALAPARSTCLSSCGTPAPRLWWPPSLRLCPGASRAPPSWMPASEHTASSVLSVARPRPHWTWLAAFSSRVLGPQLVIPNAEAVVLCCINAWCCGLLKCSELVVSPAWHKSLMHLRAAADNLLRSILGSVRSQSGQA